MNENKLTNPATNSIFSFIYPLLFSLMVIMALILILSIIATGIVYFTDMSEGYLRPMGILISTIALFFGGLSFGRKRKKRGFLGGLFLGVIFILIMAVIIIFTNGDLKSILDKMVYLILASTIGGICGIK